MSFFVVIAFAVATFISLVIAASMYTSGPAYLFITLALVSFLGFYFSPTIIAMMRKRSKIGPIAILNFFLGWSLVGWVVALVWAYSDTEATPRYKAGADFRFPPAPPATKPCPYCAEAILKEAIKCKHCGSDLEPSALRA